MFKHFPATAVCKIFTLLFSYPQIIVIFQLFSRNCNKILVTPCCPQLFQCIIKQSKVEKEALFEIPSKWEEVGGQMWSVLSYISFVTPSE